MDKFSDPRRVNDSMSMVYEDLFSAAYRRAAVKSAKALFNSGLSLKEQLDLLLNQLYSVMCRSPNGFAYELHQLQKHFNNMPRDYYEDVKNTIVVNRDTHLGPPPPSGKYDDLEDVFSGMSAPISGEAQHHCFRVIRLALDGMSPDKRYHLTFMIYYVALLTKDVMKEPEAFVEEHIAATMIGLMNQDDHEEAVN
jgi:hypothetical protein